MDLRDSRNGVVRFASWLRASGACDRLVGVHVVDLEEPYEANAELMQKARLALNDWVEQLGVAAVFDELVVVNASRVDEALHQACAERPDAGLIVGRRTGQDEQGIIRLGATTRRLLRRLEAPIVVVPPDLDPATLGSGPVMVAITTTEEASLAALRFGSDIARSMQREVELVCVTPSRSASAYLPAALAGEQQERRRVQTERDLTIWKKENEIHAKTQVFSGPVIERLLGQVSEKGVPLVVCGRNKATTIQRFLGGTTSTELSTFSRVPVAVVAPTSALRP
jgi:nucleotide-binding universal stress UspA family protein